MVSLEMVVRNDTGTICLCAVSRIDNVASLLHAKLKAIAFGMEITKENSFSSILIESDSLLVIKEIMKNKESFYQWECIISDIHEMSLEFRHYSFSHIRRTGNVCAHNVAKLPCVLGNHIVRRNSIPHNLCNPDFIS
ncbi:hypothetical protein CRYUN_Cryun37aG0037900 [Craigia yunnanensis]